MRSRLFTGFGMDQVLEKGWLIWEGRVQRVISGIGTSLEALVLGILAFYLSSQMMDSLRMEH